MTALFAKENEKVLESECLYGVTILGSRASRAAIRGLLRHLQFCYSGVLNKQYFLSIYSILQTILFSSIMVVGRVGPPHPQICSKSSAPGPGNVISFENGIFADTIQLRCDCTGLGWALPNPITGALTRRAFEHRDTEQVM